MTARILIVDDVPANIRLLEARLQTEYYRTATARDGFEAIATAKDWQPDLILLDMMLPEFDGNAVVHALQADEDVADIPVVFLSARTAPEDIRDAYRAGAVDYITKPFDPVELAERVGRVLDRVSEGGADAFRHAELARLGLL